MPLIERIASSISEKSRARKFHQFLDLLHPSPAETILDVGVNVEEYSEADNYLERHYQYPSNITALGTGDMRQFHARYPKVTVLSGDGRGLPFDDNTFTIGYSNAVLEHVGDTEAQVAFLKELLRVSERAYLTTPNRLFPIEIHTRLPLIHLFLSKKSFDRVLRAIGKSWAAGDYMNLLSEKELRAVLNQAGITSFQFIKNRFFGWPMTFTVVWEK